MKKIWKTYGIRLLAMCAALALGMTAPAGAISWTLEDKTPAPAITGSPTPAPTPPPTAAPKKTPAPIPDDGVKASKISDDGMLRVYLKSMGDPMALNITLDGLYTVDGDAGFRFARGTEIQLTAAEDGIYLAVGGLTMLMGSSFSLIRRDDGGEAPGMYISESERDTRFEGDLKISIADNGGLMPVLTIFVEDYLYGVVAYEMSDSFPIEALKAQAVAARTYAMQRKGGSRYDLVDTTADQVFKGYDPEYANVAAAVDATRGVVGTYKGSYAGCYYSASNGGQTALTSDVWGSGGDYGYLARTDDPYDLENPRSMVKTAAINKDGTGNEALLAMLEAKLAAAVKAQGGRYSEVQVTGIVDIEPESPKAEGSIMYTKLRFTLTGRGRAAPDYSSPADDLDGLTTARPDTEEAQDAAFGIAFLRRWMLNKPYTESAGSWEALDGEYEVTLSVYDDIKDGLQIGLNSTDVETVSVEEGNNGFSISLRRFGHGVGMSQRGAQQMAGKYGKSYLDILGFYYPGMDIERISWKTKELESIDALPADVGAFRPRPTPTPTPAPLPALQKGEYYATVKVDSGSSLNVREGPGTNYPVQAFMASGRRVIVTGDAGDGWVTIKTAEFTGYVKADYLAKE